MWHRRTLNFLWLHVNNIDAVLVVMMMVMVVVVVIMVICQVSEYLIRRSFSIVMVVMLVVMPVLMASWNQREAGLVIVHCIEFSLDIWYPCVCVCKQIHDSKLVFHGDNRGWKIDSSVRNEPRLNNKLDIEHIIQIAQLYGGTLLDKINT